MFKVYLQLFRPTASSLSMLWQGHVRNTLFHFCQLRAVKCYQFLADYPIGHPRENTTHSLVDLTKVLHRRNVSFR